MKIATDSGQLLSFTLSCALDINLQHQGRDPSAPRFLDPFLRRAVAILPEYSRILQKNSPRAAMASKFRFRDEIITLPHWTQSRRPRPGSNMTSMAHRPPASAKCAGTRGRFSPSPMARKRLETIGLLFRVPQLIRCFVPARGNFFNLRL